MKMDIHELKRKLYQCDLEDPDLLIQLAHNIQRCQYKVWNVEVHLYIYKDDEAQITLNYAAGIENISLNSFLNYTADLGLKRARQIHKILKDCSGHVYAHPEKPFEFMIKLNNIEFSFQTIHPLYRDVVIKNNFPKIKFEVPDIVKIFDLRVPAHYR